MSQGTKMPGSALRAILKTVGDWAAAGVSPATPNTASNSAAPSVRVNRFVHFLSRADMLSPFGYQHLGGLDLRSLRSRAPTMIERLGFALCDLTSTSVAARA